VTKVFRATPDLLLEEVVFVEVVVCGVVGYASFVVVLAASPSSSPINLSLLNLFSLNISLLKLLFSVNLF
jgi:hypothetical protein